MKIVKFIIHAVIFLAPLGYILAKFSIQADPLSFIYSVSGYSVLCSLGLIVILNFINVRKYSKLLGFFGFFYAFLHFLTFVILDKGLNLAKVYSDILSQNFALSGFIGLVLMAILAVSSLKFSWFRKVGLLFYPLLICAALHYFLYPKIPQLWHYSFLIFACLVAVIKVLNLIQKYKNNLKEA
ncbi:ferric reductase-like transmembrane domain-containing protein [Campylobacter geochelonis]|uniref:ferric reductase-like transmembrane domain-containing protein n=1 Tax=Campylobacter geochelonis TaxID=1780362 RepID=UPI0007707990|nr:ferric reductase-like transmembrane domain-containing protein [Campylobacter geochelonis]CZE47697.1 membrane protein [Campylobacter geochelonis]